MKRVLSGAAPSVEELQECETFVHQSYYRLRNLQISETNGLVLAAKYRITNAIINLCRNMGKRLKTEVTLFQNVNWLLYLENNYFRNYMRFVEETEKTFLLHNTRLNTSELIIKVKQYVEHLEAVKSYFPRQIPNSLDSRQLLGIFVQRRNKLDNYAGQLSNLGRSLHLLPVFQEINKLFADLEKLFKQNTDLSYRQTDYIVKRLERLLEDYRQLNIPLLDNYHTSLVEKLLHVKSATDSTSALNSVIKGEIINLKDITPDKAFTLMKNEKQRQNVLSKINNQSFNKTQYQTIKSFLVVVDSQRFLTIDKLKDLFADICSVLEKPLDDDMSTYDKLIRLKPFINDLKELMEKTRKHIESMMQIKKTNALNLLNILQYNDNRLKLEISMARLLHYAYQSLYYLLKGWHHTSVNHKGVFRFNDQSQIQCIMRYIVPIFDQLTYLKRTLHSQTEIFNKYNLIEPLKPLLNRTMSLVYETIGVKKDTIEINLSFFYQLNKMFKRNEEVLLKLLNMLRTRDKPKRLVENFNEYIVFAENCKEFLAEVDLDEHVATISIFFEVIDYDLFDRFNDFIVNFQAICQQFVYRLENDPSYNLEYLMQLRDEKPEFFNIITIFVNNSKEVYE